MLDRRDFLARSSLFAAGHRLLRGAWRYGTESDFAHGIASGDPLPTGVVIWTRVAPEAGGGTAPVPLGWAVARDPAISNVIASGDAEAHPARGWTVHVEVSGLEPATTYYFRFETGSATSPVGRTRTAPDENSRDPVRLGVVACGSYAYGRFNAYARLAERDVDLVVHLGDAIYDLGGGTGERRHRPDRPLIELDDYRERHAQYRADPDLQRLLARQPVAFIWDDHDIAGNAWRDEPGGARRGAATQAWREWMPVRRTEEVSAPIWRSLRLGRVAELILLDTRMDGRDRQVSKDDPDPAAAIVDPTRALIGEAQRTWLHERLRDTETAWRVLGNQVMLSPLQMKGLTSTIARLTGPTALAVDGRLINPDQWDGYVGERARLLAVLGERPGTTVVLTGDIHSSWASEVPSGAETGGGTAVAVEIVTPAVASETFGEVLGLSVTGLAEGAIRAQNPHIRWADLDRHGYAVVELRDDGMSADWWHVATVERPSNEERFAAGWDAALGVPRLTRRDEPLPERTARRRLARRPQEGSEGLAGWAWGAGATAIAAVAAGAIALRRRRQ